jgi:hypothetical protein
MLSKTTEERQTQCQCLCHVITDCIAVKAKLFLTGIIARINPLKTKRRPLYLKTQSYRAVNTFHLGYKNQSVYAVSGTSRCLFSDKYKKH